MADVETQAATEAPVVDGDAAAEAAVNGTTGKIPSTPEGMALAYGSLMVMAMIPIFVGSFRSVTSHKEQRESSSLTGEKPETLTRRDAAMFPLVASCALFGLYVFFQVFSKEHINLLLSVYFFFLGVAALAHMTSPAANRLVPTNTTYHLELTSKEEAKANAAAKDEDSSSTTAASSMFSYDFTIVDVAVLACAGLVGIWYLVKKHWLANNLFGMAFAINGVELLHLNKVVTGCILLGGLFFYDIFWVFGTDVMVTVAKSFEAPIKLVFPQDIIENGVMGATNMAMLGLGDIVIPGIFIALLLRYDQTLKRGSNFYFYTTYVAYFLGLVATMVVMHVFKHAQPALLYLVPACLGAPIAMALVRGDLASMFCYADHPEDEEEEVKKEEEETKKTS